MSPEEGFKTLGQFELSRVGRGHFTKISVLALSWQELRLRDVTKWVAIWERVHIKRATTASSFKITYFFLVLVSSVQNNS